MTKIKELYPKHQKPVFPNQLVTVSDLEEFKKDLLLSIKLLVAENKDRSVKWLKSYQVKKILGISSGTLQTLRNNGTLLFSKIGGIIYYNAEEINKALENRGKLIKKQSMPLFKKN